MDGHRGLLLPLLFLSLIHILSLAEANLVWNFGHSADMLAKDG